MQIDKNTLSSNMNIVRIAGKTHIMTYSPEGVYERYPNEPLCGCKWDFVDDETAATEELTCVRCQRSYNKMIREKGTE